MKKNRFAMKKNPFIRFRMRYTNTEVSFIAAGTAYAYAICPEVMVTVIGASPRQAGMKDWPIVGRVSQ